MGKIRFSSAIALLLFFVFGQCFGESLPPKDSNRNQLVVVGDPDGPAKWFDSVPELSAVKARSNYTSYATNSKLFKERYASLYGTDYPIVAYTRPDGGVIYFADKNSMPSREDLFGELKAAAILARDAKPAGKDISERFAQAVSEIDDMLGTCPDGNCKPKPDTSIDTPVLFPKLHPFRDTKQPALVSGLFGNAITNGIYLITAIVALTVVFFAFIFLLVAMVIAYRMLPK